MSMLRSNRLKAPLKKELPKVPPRELQVYVLFQVLTTSRNILIYQQEAVAVEGAAKKGAVKEGAAVRILLDTSLQLPRIN